MNHFLDNKRNVFILAFIAIFLESLTSACLKIGGRYGFLSTGYFVWFIIAVVLLGVYAVIWQLILERLPLTTAYLRRGISYIEFSSPDVIIESVSSATGKSDEYLADSFICDGAKTVNSFVTDISCENKNSATLKVNAEKDGIYALSVKYANDGEGGLHDYNVDLIEKYVTMKVNNTKIGNIYFRNTYSLDTLKTKLIYVKLKSGENEIVFSNNGELKFNGIETFAPEIYSVTVSGAME